jgi:hypothetical protein
MVALIGGPHWDDGLIRLLDLRGGPSAVFDAHREVPLYAGLMQALLEWELFWQASALAHFLGWVGTGLVAGGLFRLLAGHRDVLAEAVAGTIAATAMIGQYYCHLSTTWGVLGVPLLLWAVWFLAGRHTRGPGRHLIDVMVIVTTAVCFLFSQYSLTVFLAALPVFLLRNDRPIPRHRVQLIAATAALALIAFFALVGDGHARPSLSLEALLRTALPKGLLFPERFTEGLWSVSAGLLIERVGAVDFYRARKAVAAGCLLTAVVIGALWRQATVSLSEEKSLVPALRRSLLGLALGILPVVATGRMLDVGVFSRYWVPLAPLAAAQCVLVCRLALAAPLARKLVFAALLFTCGYAFELALERFLDRDRSVREAAQIVRQHLVGEGTTKTTAVVVVMAPQPVRWPFEQPSWFELTSRFQLADPAFLEHPLIVLEGDHAGFENALQQHPLEVQLRGTELFREDIQYAFFLERADEGWIVASQWQRSAPGRTGDAR